MATIAGMKAINLNPEPPSTPFDLGVTRPAALPLALALQPLATGRPSRS